MWEMKEGKHQVPTPGAESMLGLFKECKGFQGKNTVCSGKRRRKASEAARARACGVLKALIRSLGPSSERGNMQELEQRSDLCRLEKAIYSR